MSLYGGAQVLIYCTSKVGSLSLALGYLCHRFGGSVSQSSLHNTCLSSVESSEDVSYHWRSSFAKYSLSLWAQRTQLEALLTVNNNNGEEGCLCHFPTDLLHSSGSLWSPVSHTL